jgi:hypothetical protein
MYYNAVKKLPIREGKPWGRERGGFQEASVGEEKVDSFKLT